MENKVIGFTASLFAIGALIHLARFFFCPFHIEIGSWVVPIWLSPIIFLFSGTLSVLLCSSMKNSYQENP